ncbi:hypothetical protein ACIBO1_29515 [Micromonospora sp. NPDC049903]|uniref:hypothetical protein n=1 Tax=Micromonospora sp. NPDC049903 TaxID=3364276 RepID=UPI0037A1E984
MSSAIGGLIVWIMVTFHINLFIAVLSIAAFFLLLLMLQILRILRPRVTLSVTVLIWGASAVHASANMGPIALLLICVAPILSIVALRASVRAAILALRVPAFIPAALALVLAPLFTEDPWRFAAASQERIFLLGGIAVLPLLFMVLLRLRRIPLEPIFERAGSALVADADRAVEVSQRILKSRVRSTEHRPPAEAIEPFLRRGFQGHHFAATLDELRLRATSEFRRRAALRVLSLLAGTTTATYALIYSMTAATMPAPLAADWSNASFSEVSLEWLLGMPITVPLWPYVGVAGLFSIVAAVAFLALILTEESYTTAVIDAVYGHLATLLIATGAPLLASDKIRGSTPGFSAETSTLTSTPDVPVQHTPDSSPGIVQAGRRKRKRRR